LRYLKIKVGRIRELTHW